VAQLLETGRLQRSKRVPRGHAQNAFDLRKFLGLQRGLGLVVLHQHQVRVVALEAVLDASQEFHLDLEASRDALVSECLERRQGRFGWQDAVDDHQQPRLPALGELLRQRLDVASLGQQPSSLGQDRLARCGELDAVTRAVEDGHTELPLELAHLVADCGLDLVQPLCRAGEPAAAHHRIESFEAIQVESHEYLIF